MMVPRLWLSSSHGTSLAQVDTVHTRRYSYDDVNVVYIVAVHYFADDLGWDMHKLTARETQVVRLICDGHSTKQIAQRLGIAHKTADVHRQRACVNSAQGIQPCLYAALSGKGW